jgi:hypothetical protein
MKFLITYLLNNFIEFFKICSIEWNMKTLWFGNTQKVIILLSCLRSVALNEI